MIHNCDHGVNDTFHCFNCESKVSRKELEAEFRSWEFTWSRLNGRLPSAFDGWMSQRYKIKRSDPGLRTAAKMYYVYFDDRKTPYYDKPEYGGNMVSVD